MPLTMMCPDVVLSQNSLEMLLLMYDVLLPFAFVIVVLRLDSVRGGQVGFFYRKSSLNTP